ncbi:MAG: helix-turn-helix domain-containing protein [Devosia sp.]
MASWSTDQIASRERFSFWREVIGETVFNVTAEGPSGDFRAQISAQNFGELRIAAFTASGHELVRSRKQAERNPENSYLISLPIAGRSHARQGEQELTIEANEISIIDGQKPFRIAYPDNIDRVIAVVPHAVLDQRAPWLRSRLLCRIAVDAPFAGLARQHLLQFAAGGASLSESAAGMLAENLANLLALASAPDLAPNRLRPDMQLEALLAYCRRNLHDADLSPGVVATHLGISVRTLHLRFQMLGESFGRWLLARRLEACSKALLDPHQMVSGVSEIAYRWGFNDLSHFNRSFRCRFGMSPREWRTQVKAII